MPSVYYATKSQESQSVGLFLWQNRGELAIIILPTGTLREGGETVNMRRCGIISAEASQRLHLPAKASLEA